MRGGIQTVEQGTAEWFEARVGKVTASEVWKVMAFTETTTLKSGKVKPGKPKADYWNYLDDIIGEILTEQPADHFVTDAMKDGQMQEADACELYSIQNNVMVDKVGFVDHPTIPRFGASPDRLVGPVGMVEAKCPKKSTHIRMLRTGDIDSKYVYQMHAQLMCTGREWCDFISFYFGLPLFQVRVFPDAAIHKAIEERVREFVELAIDQASKIGEDVA